MGQHCGLTATIPLGDLVRFSVKRDGFIWKPTEHSSKHNSGFYNIVVHNRQMLFESQTEMTCGIKSTNEYRL